MKAFKKTVQRLLFWAASIVLMPLSHSAAEITGQVYDIDGNPVVAVTVTFVQEQVSSGSFSALTDAEGAYVIKTETSVGSVADTAPAGMKLYQNYPNPFNPFTTIPFYIDAPGYTELTVYDILGRYVQTLISGDISEGMHAVRWDGTDDRGFSCGAGVYLTVSSQEGI